MIGKLTRTIVRTFAFALALCATTSAWAVYAPGDTIEWSNTSTTAAIYSGSDPAVINECHFDFQIPASADLPAGSVVKIKSITFASLNTDGKFYREQNNYKSDPGFINLNGVKSDAVNGVTFSSDNYTGTFTDKINSTTTQEDYALKYTFSSDCRITVGTTYPADTAASKGATGKGIAFLHPNGNCIYGSSTDKASVRYVQSPASNALITPYESTSSTTGKGNGKVAKDAGYYPVYIVKAEVVSIYSAKSPDFEYNAVVGNAYSSDNSGKWGTSTPSGNFYRVGPNCNDLVIEYSANNNSPWWDMAAKSSAFSFITYADVSQTQSSGKIVLFAFGASSGNNTCVLYREGGYIKLGYYLTGTTLVGTAAEVALPSSGYHMIAGVCDPTKGTLKLSVGKNDGTLSSAAGGTATEQTVAMNAGFQICSIFHGNGGFTKANNLALAKILGFDRALSDEVVESFLSDFPATDGTQITADIDSSINEKTLTVYASSAMGNQALVASKGNLTIPANNVVNVPQMRMDTGSASSTVTINGQLNITSTMDPIEAGKTPYDLKASYKGILMGGAAADGAHGHCVINGVLNAPNAYFQTERGGSGSDITIQNGGSLLVKGLYDGGNWADSICTINLTGGGTLQVGEIVTMNVSYPGIRNFGNGTYKVLTSGEENTAIAFNAGIGEYTILDPAGNTLTIPNQAYTTISSQKTQVCAVKGSGDIKVASSVSGGKVKFNGITTDYTGNITVAANSTMELVAGAYAGTITVEAGGTLEINPGASVDYTCNATLTGAGSVVIKSGTVTLANAPTVTSAILVDAGATLKLPTGTISGVTGSGALEIPDGVEVTITANNVITVASLKGPGSLVLSGVGPGASNTALQGLLQNSNWNGTFAIKSVTGDASNGLNLLKPHLWGNSGSKLLLTGVAGFFDKQTTAENVAAQPELVLINGTGDRAYGYNSNNGWSYTQSSQRSTTYYSIIRKLSGTGTLYDNNAPTQLYVFNDASGFSGSINQTANGGKTYLFDSTVTPNNLPDNSNTGTTFDDAKVTAGTVDVRAGASISIGSGESWTTRNGIRIAGNVTLKGSATLSSATTFVGGSKLIFEAGSVLNATTVTLPATGTVTLDVTGLTIPSAGYTLISGVTFTAADCAKFSIVAGTGKYYALEPDGTTLKIFPNGASLTANQSVVRYESLMGAIMSLYASEFADAYVTELGDNTAYGDSDLLGINIAHDADGNYYKATVKIGTKGYKSLARAIELAADEDTVTLIRDNGESSVALNDKTVSLNEYNFTFSGSFTGNGTLALTALLKSEDPARWAEGWTGTVWLKNQNDIQIVPANYGNANSVIRFTGITGLIADGTTCSPAFEFEDDGDTKALTMYYTSAPNTTLTFSEFRGTGTFVTAGDGSGYTRTNFRVLKWSDFTGSLDIDRGRVIFGQDTISNDDWRYIYVSANETVTVAQGKTWVAPIGIVVNGTLNVAGTVTGGITGGDGLVNLTGGSVDLGTLGAAITHKYVAVSGESSLTLQCEYNNGSGVIFNGDTIANPFIKVESGATLNLSYGNFSGWNGDVCDGYIVNEGTLNISQKGSVSTFFRNHLILTDGCTTTISGTSKLSLYGGVATESTAQIQLASGTAELSSASGRIGFGNVSNSGGYGGKGVGITVGADATLTISAQIDASNVNSGSNPVAKYGNGTLILSNESNSNVESWTLYAGTIKSKVALTVISGNDTLRGVSDSIVDGYHVYNLVSVSSPLEVTAKTFSFNLFTYGDMTVTLGDGDTIVVPSDCTGDQWHPSLSNAAGHNVIVRKSMNWNAGIGTMTIDSGVTVFAYRANGTAINDGAVISGSGTLSLQDSVPVNGVASVLCTISGGGSFSLASRNATLTVSSPLADGKVTTSVTGAKVISESVDAGTRYRVVYGTIFSVY